MYTLYVCMFVYDTEKLYMYTRMVWMLYVSDIDVCMYVSKSVCMYVCLFAVCLLQVCPYVCTFVCMHLCCMYEYMYVHMHARTNGVHAKYPTTMSCMRQRWMCRWKTKKAKRH